MLQAASKACGALLRQHGLRALPGASQLSAAWLPAAAAACGPSAAFTTGASRSRSGGGRRTEGAHSAAEELAAAARESVRHAAEGDMGAMAQDAVSMAQAGARGAAETTKLVFESVTGLNLSSGSEGSSSVGSAASAAADAAGRAADTMASGASAVYQETVGAMSRTTVPGAAAKGPESTYRNDPGDWAGVMVESAVETSSPSGWQSGGRAAAGSGGALGGEDIGASSKGSGAGGAGFASPSAAGLGGGRGLGGLGGIAGGGTGGGGTGGTGLGSGISERAFEEVEFSLAEGPADRSASHATPASAFGSEGDWEFGREAAAIRATAEAMEAAEGAGPAPQGSVEDEFGVQGQGGKRQA